jgi:hypothetical protein
MKKNRTRKQIEKWVKTLIDENGLTLETMIEAYMSGVLDGAVDHKLVDRVLKIIGEKNNIL